MIESVQHSVLREQADRLRHAFEHAAAVCGVVLSDVWLERVGCLGCASPFMGQQLLRDPAVLQTFVADGDWQSLLSAGNDEGCLQLPGSLGLMSELEFMSALRRLRQREMVYIGIRDLLGWASVEETLAALSALADGCIRLSVERAGFEVERLHGTACDTSGRILQLLVLGMGKLGGCELNYSSDIDLVFFYAEPGVTRCVQSGQRPVEHQVFFTRIGQRVIRYLHEPTADGFVFRVDMRLRPDGDAGPLVMHFDAMERYYQSQGRDWERYAFIKSRVIVGDAGDRARAGEILRPFVYRRYLDYGAFESLREMKLMIEREEARRLSQDNIKLGAGGIREVEFIGQAFQLIRGGREVELQQRGILAVLAVLGSRGILEQARVLLLCDAYRFLRQVENRLQMMGDQQVHHLPTDVLERARLVYAMGFTDWDSFLICLEAHRVQVRGCFTEVFALEDSVARSAQHVALEDIWLGAPLDVAEDPLRCMGFVDPVFLLDMLRKLRGSRAVHQMSTAARQRLDRLMPVLLEALAQRAVEREAVTRIMDFIAAISRRSVYLALLSEYPAVLARVVEFFAASSWLATYLTQHPVLLDSLIDAQQFSSLPDKGGMGESLRGLLQGVAYDDLERQLDLLRQFKHEQVFRIAAADISSHLPLMRVSDYLTELAETLLQVVCERAWLQLTRQHGVPQYVLNGQLCDAQLAIVGYGKLGGIELGYGSDLDIIFLHDSTGEQQVTNGVSGLDNQTFFLRLARRIMHFLGTHTINGILYELDLRLRPDGDSGLLVASVAGFERYQREEAWTWEHQALVRARVIVGSPQIRCEFERVRRSVLCRARDPQVLRQEVLQMRERMRGESLRIRMGEFDLKQDRGGIVDIEFAVQYMVLGYAHLHAGMCRYTDNIRLLESCADANIISAEQASELIEAYRRLRARLHRQVLLGRQAAVVDIQDLCVHIEAVKKIFHLLLES